MAYTFDYLDARDPANPANRAANASVTIHAVGDATKTPLTITTTDGTPLPNPITVGADGYGPAFMHATLDRVAWSGGGYTNFMTAYEGIKNEAIAARTAADTAAAEAAASASLVNAPADTTMQGLINNTASATRGALNATYAPAATTTENLSLGLLASQASADRSKSSSTSRIAYEDSATLTESWANLTAWSSSTFAQVSGGRLYANGTTGGASGANRSYTMAATETARVLFNVRFDAGAPSGGLIVGVTSDAAGAAFSGGGATMRGLYFTGTLIKVFTNGVSGDTLLDYGADRTVSDWVVTMTIDETYLTMTAVRISDQKTVQYKWTRGTINNIAVFNSDSRQLTGYSIGMIGARKSTVTLAARAGLEDQVTTPHWTTSGSSNFRIALPKTYDSRRPSPVVMMFHGNGGDELQVVTHTPSKTIHDAFLAAGYIVLTATFTNKFTWGNQSSLDAYHTAYKYLRDHYAIGPVVFYGNSMGGIESLLTLAERRIPGVVAWIGTVPTTNLAENHANPLFTAAIRDNYGIAADGSDYATKTAGHDPNLKPGYAFRGVPMYALLATDDASVTPSANWQAFSPIVAPYARELTTVNVTGGHSTSQIETRASEYVAFADKYAK